MRGLSTDRNEWNRALELCTIVESERPYGGPELEEMSEGFFVLMGGSTSDAFSAFHEMLYSLGIVTPRNSPGPDFEIENNLDIDSLPARKLSELITGICRGDRFCEGLLIHHINDGLVTSAFRRLRELHLLELNRPRSPGNRV